MEVSIHSRIPKRDGGDRLLAGLAGAAIALATAALYVRHRTRRAERQTPPAGRLIDIDGVRLHVVERGTGDPIVLLHGNGGLYQDFAVSGLIDRLAARYRVVAFDRPGFGYSPRRRSRSWTPEAQAALLHEAFAALGIRNPVVVGHSWGALVAVALGLDHPHDVKSLVLLSGFYFPKARADAAVVALLLGTPLLGDLLRASVAPLAARLMWPAILAKLFGPNPVPARFALFPRWLALRPAHLRAIGAEMALMVPAALRLSRRYGALGMPVFILAGDADRLASARLHSERLHRAVPGSRLRILAGVGHMIHHVATGRVAATIDRAARG